MAPQWNVNTNDDDKGIVSHSGNSMFPFASTSSAPEVDEQSSRRGAESRKRKRSNLPGAGCPFCIVPNNDARVRYDGVWILNSVPGSTTHSTTTIGSSLSLKFFGSGIIVYGTVPASNGIFKPPTASYSVDNDQPLTTTLARASSSIPNQQFFATSQMLSSDQHEIQINVTDVEDVPYIISQFFIVPAFNVTQTPKPLTGGNETMTTTPAPHAALQHTVRVLSAVLGILIFLILAAVITMFLLLRKLKYKRKIAEKLGFDVRSRRPDTIYSSFTSPESILRADAGIWSPSQSSRLTQLTYSSRSQSITRSAFATPYAEKEIPPPPLPPKAFGPTTKHGAIS
ncbi:hypothetical protein BJ165DRAFT_1401298 [Panaeolus papilionaceus]|nr:hypothetical protein BJ165DRAFT_1401298 [Panaeolus papilionaceus]